MLFYAIASAQTFGGLNQGISRRWSAIVPEKIRTTRHRGVDCYDENDE
ncbi:MAG: hypothetical protein LKF33_09600 [Prevotella sp.]|nr:hypothetical protein [Prevotella sp.]